jgi:hypothetical protein
MTEEPPPLERGDLGSKGCAKLGYKWHVGNGKRVGFWEDLWVRSCSLAIQY